MKTTTRQLIVYSRGAIAQIDRLSTSRKERRENRMRLANAVKDGRRQLGSTRQREHLLTLAPPR